MNRHLNHILLSVTLLLLVTSFLIAGSLDGVYSETQPTFTLSETDLSRAEWKMDHFANPGFEEWTADHEIDDLYTYRSTEHYSWYAESPWPVNEGSRSRGFQSKAIDPLHPSLAYTGRDSWPYWNNPMNLTMKFDWFIDVLPLSVDSDYFRLDLQIEVSSTRHIYYYFNSEDTSKFNQSGYAYYFMTDASQSWNTFDRNITEDCFELFGAYPTQFQEFRFELMTASQEYSRAFIDDLWVVNGTVVYGGSHGNGNFESNSGWHHTGNTAAADISRNSDRQQGEWSLNATANSDGNRSRLDVDYDPERRISPLNPDTFSFKWKMNEFTGANEDTFAYVAVSCLNDSDSFTVFYVLAYGDNTNTFTWEGARVVNVPGFNTTGQWFSFSRSIWEDISSFNMTDYIIIEEIEISIRTDGPDSRISILFDDMKFESAALDDRGYEDQPAVGEMALSWSADNGPQPEFTVTDTAYSGSKAANLTVANGNSWSGDSRFDNMPINQFNDTWLDFYWMIQDSSALAEDLIYLELDFSSGHQLGYIFANYSDVPTGNGFDEFIIIPEANIASEWHNFQRNLYDDYVAAFGMIPDTELREIYLSIEADTGGRLTVLFDDVYLYNDPAPGFSDVYLTPMIANVDVNVSTQVTDLSEFSVTLYYRIDGGSWTDVAITETDGWFNSTIPGQTYNTEVDFYLEATDVFEQISQTSQVGYTIPDEQQPPLNLIPIIAVVAVIAVVGVVIIYFLVIKPKQATG